MHVDCWIQQVTTRVGAVTCWIQQSVSPKQVVGFSCLFNKEVDQLISKAEVRRRATSGYCKRETSLTGSELSHPQACRMEMFLTALPFSSTLH